MRSRIRRWWRVRRQAVGGGRGQSGVSTLEFLVIAPILLFISLVVLQLGVYFLASTAAHTAARKGAQSGAQFQSSPGQGAARAEDWLARVGVVQQARVSTAGSSRERVRVTVSGRVMNFLPWDVRIERSAEDTVEKNQ
ncbi:TadE/TadG family type IV pilus assembly protein [Streptomyces sp. NPDC058284]|uniref:TadE/TadG family type IV pilus assembly protein n=1 Tax=unclassified Streptomyces TaxID=2593676 RepID=UPI003647248B